MNLSLVLLLSLLCGVLGEPQPTELYKFHQDFDNGNIIVFWKATDTHITFEVHGNTTGWIGIGFSPNGGMGGADMIVGWVKNGEVHVTDRHASSNTFPPKDPKQDIDVIYGRECDGWTIFKFSRQLAACEAKYDREISHGTQRFIWARGASDPTGDDIGPESYHGESRGTKSLYLLEQVDKDSDKLPEGLKYKHFDVVASKLHLPSSRTYYNCRMDRIDGIFEKNHIVKISPIIKKENLRNVHHMLAYICPADQSAEGAGVDIPCSFGKHRSFTFCTKIIGAWAIGSGPLIFPEATGLPLGNTAGNPVYFVLETHYDNPENRSDIIDSSGLRFTYTNTLRKHDAGVVAVGSIISGLNQVIPHGSKHFTSTGFCTGDCLKKGMEEVKTENLTIFMAQLHTHLAGRAVTLRHFRDEKELPYIAYDKTYDFNYQPTRHITPVVEVKPDDLLRVDCVYNTEGKKEVLEGGLGTEEEMCIAFVVYYPAIDLDYCQASPFHRDLLKYFEVTDMTGTGITLNNYTATEPEKFKGKSLMEVYSEYNWTKENMAKFSKDSLEMTQMQVCVGETFTRRPTFFKIPNITSEYEIPTQKCAVETGNLAQTKDANRCEIPFTSAPDVDETTTGSGAQQLGNNGCLLLVMMLVMKILSK